MQYIVNSYVFLFLKKHKISWGEYMKNAINYYYNIVPNSIHQMGKIYRFTTNDSNYILTPFDLVHEVKDIYELSNSLLQKGVPINQIILNNSNQVLTTINEMSYVLMKIHIPNNILTFEDIINFNNFNVRNSENNKLIRNDWFTLWTKKIDYFEYQINQLGKKYPLIRESFSYFVGLAENAISLVKNTPIDNSRLVVGHRRIRANDTLYDLYNPLNLIIDYRVRDITEYFKSAFLNNEYNIEEIMSYLYYANLSNTECILFFARMLFPTFYFDIYEKIISEHGTEEELIIIIEKIEDYENLITKLYYYFKSIMPFPEIEWLKKRIS